MATSKKIDSRKVTSPRPYAMCKSRAYHLLDFGRMVARPFTSQEIKDVLRGVFNSERLECVTGPANQLAKKNFLKKLDTHLWQITPEGIGELQRSITYYREMKMRLLGATYLEKVSERERRARMKVSVKEQWDMEEEILEEVAEKINKAKSRNKNGNNKK